MSEPLPRTHLLAYGAVLLVVVVLGLRALGGDPPSEPAAKIALDQPAAASPPPAAGASPEAPATAPGPSASPSGAGAATTGQVTVHVAGAVRRPGLYRLEPGALVDDAITRAGGPTRRAELAAVNLAARAEDGRQILVPDRRDRTAAAASAAPASPASGAGTDAGGGATEGPINLNTATLEQLDTLDGVGPTTAQKILDHREASGGFRSVDELDQIPGIGEKRMAALREQVTV